MPRKTIIVFMIIKRCGRPELRGSVGRFVTQWAAFSSLFAVAGGNCPCCGQPGCPVGAVGVGAFGAVIMSAAQLCRGMFTRGDRKPETSAPDQTHPSTSPTSSIDPANRA